MRIVVNNLIAVKSLMIDALTSCNKIVMLIFLACSIYSCSTKPPDFKDYDFVMDKNVKKKAVIMVYEALLHGEVIRKGEKVEYLASVDAKSYSQIYFDEFGNKLFEANYSFGDGKTLFSTVKTVRSGNRNNLVRIVYKRSFDNYSKTIYIFNSIGKLIEIVEHSYSKDQRKYNSRELSSYKYDSSGNLIEIILYDGKWDGEKLIPVLKEIRQFSNYNSNGGYQNIETYNSIYQLIKEVAIEYYPNSRLYRAEYSKYYQNGRLTDETRNYFVFDSNENIVIQRSIENERDELIYRTFDSHNNLTHFNSNRVASFKYNSLGDWTEQIIYRSNRPTWIVERTFTYY